MARKLSADAAGYAGRRAAPGSEIAADLRSDTVTRPGAAMRVAMHEAAVGDDVYGEDPTINALEKRAAKLLGKRAGLFLPSASQSNLAAVMSHCGRGEEILVGEPYHIFSYEAGGGAVLAGVAAHPLPVAADGSISAEQARAAIKPDDPHCPISRLLCLENTINGAALPIERIAGPAAAAREVGLSVHLDGARLFNAAVALGVSPAEIAAPADSVTICLSKGLGAPVGAVLCGAPKFIATARRARKLLGGAMRQAGVLAAAGLYALEHNVARLAEDHARAERLAKAIAKSPYLQVEKRGQRTNMIFARVEPAHRETLQAHLQRSGVLVGGRPPHFRLVTHMDVDDAGLDAAIKAFASYRG